MKNKAIRNFQIQIWFEGLPDKVLLDTVSVYADTEEEAIELAQNHTEYKVSGVDEVTWQVRDTEMHHYLITT